MSLDENGNAGYDLWIGGGLSTNPIFAQRVGVFVRPDQVSDVWAAVASVFRDYGYRRSRNHARLKFLVADWGTEKFRQVMEKEYLGFALPDGPAPGKSPANRDHVGVQKQRNGLNAIGVTTKSGRTSGSVARRVGRPEPAARWRTGIHHRAAGSGRSGCAGRERRGTHHRARRDRPVRATVRLPPRHDRLHRHRVLQARHRRDQGPGRGHPHRARAAPARVRHADHDQRQRLPELVRAVPGRRHRLQGHHRPRRRTARTSRRSRSTSAGSWARRPRSAASSAG